MLGARRGPESRLVGAPESGARARPTGPEGALSDQPVGGAHCWVALHEGHSSASRGTVQSEAWKQPE